MYHQDLELDGIFSTKTLWIFLLACDSDDKQKVSLIMEVKISYAFLNSFGKRLMYRELIAA